jgi:hypothetical protein
VRLKQLLRISAAVAIGLTGAVGLAGPANAAAPQFQAPFPCGQVWSGNSSASSAHVSWEIDFNRGSTATADLGDTVVAAAAGTVEVSADQGEANGYGNLIVVNHGGGYYTYYAHLNARAVVAGQTVLAGQAIGAVGNTTRSDETILPHLHYEVRYPDRSQSHIIKAVFNGTTFAYDVASVTSGNCTTSYDPATVCGNGFQMIDSAALGTAGTANLLWDASTGRNCVTTLKMADKGTPTATAAFLEPAGATRSTDSGSYSYYAGPVIAAAPGCVKWGGTAGGTTYTSALEHCG